MRSEDVVCTPSITENDGDVNGGYTAGMKNYARRTNRKVTRYRTPSPFRIRHAQRIASIRASYGNGPHHQQPPR